MPLAKLLVTTQRVAPQPAGLAAVRRAVEAVGRGRVETSAAFAFGPRVVREATEGVRLREVRMRVGWAWAAPGSAEEPPQHPTFDVTNVARLAAELDEAAAELDVPRNDVLAIVDVIKGRERECVDAVMALQHKGTRVVAAVEAETRAGPHIDELIRGGVHGIEAPHNILERSEELLDKCAAARVEFTASRPLTAFLPAEAVSFRLAEADFPLDYAAKRDALLAHVGASMDTPVAELDEAQRWLTNFVRSLDEQISKFSSVMHFEQELATRIVPMLDEAFEEMDQTTFQLLTEFLDAMGRAVRESAGHRANLRVNSVLGGTGVAPLQRRALEWVASDPRVSNVRVAFRTAEHVAEWERWWSSSSSSSP